MSSTVKTKFTDVFENVVMSEGGASTTVDDLMRLPSLDLCKWTIGQTLQTIQGVGAICGKADTLLEDVESIKKSVKNIETSLQSLDRSMKVLVQNQQPKPNPLRELYELLKVHYGRGEDVGASQTTVDPARANENVGEVRIVDVSHVTNEEFNEELNNPVSSQQKCGSTQWMENDSSLDFHYDLVNVKKEPPDSDELTSVPQSLTLSQTDGKSEPVKAGKSPANKVVRSSPPHVAKRLTHKEVRELSPMAKRRYQAWLKSQRNLRYRLNRQNRQQNSRGEESEEEQVLFDLSSEGSQERGSSFSKSRSPQPIDDGAETSPCFHFKSESRESDW